MSVYKSRFKVYINSDIQGFEKQCIKLAKYSSNILKDLI